MIVFGDFVCSMPFQSLRECVCAFRASPLCACALNKYIMQNLLRALSCIFFRLLVRASASHSLSPSSTTTTSKRLPPLCVCEHDPRTKHKMYYHFACVVHVVRIESYFYNFIMPKHRVLRCGAVLQSVETVAGNTIRLSLRHPSSSNVPRFAMRSIWIITHQMGDE